MHRNACCVTGFNRAKVRVEFLALEAPFWNLIPELATGCAALPKLECRSARSRLLAKRAVCTRGASTWHSSIALYCALMD